MQRLIDITGQRFGKLIAIERANVEKKGQAVWLCKCDCGNTKIVASSSLRAGKTMSCGCMKTKNIEGRRFGMLVAVKPSDSQGGRGIKWDCVCDCGGSVSVSVATLIAGGVKSCGCLLNQDVSGQRFGNWMALRRTCYDIKRGGAMFECVCDCGTIKEVPMARLKNGTSKSCGCQSKVKDITGQKFGMLTAIQFSHLDSKLQAWWRFRCDCGNEVVRDAANVKKENFSHSCGCTTNLIDETGNKYGLLTVIKRVENDNNKKARWLCECDCGNKAVVNGGNLRSLQTCSCGCLTVKQSRELDFRNKAQRLHRIYAGMKARCFQKSHPTYKNYGARGVSICSEWMEWDAFKEWAFDNGFQKGLSIERIDNNGNYEPSNCRWIPLNEQMRNTTRTIHCEYDGKHYTSMIGLCEENNFNYNKIRAEKRRNGGDIQAAIYKLYPISEEVSIWHS